MSKITLGILIAAVSLIVLAVMSNASFVAGGSGVVFLVGLTYAYIVTQREIERGKGSAFKTSN
jgi:hypothetical protein